jgi:hypothetical protein
MRTYIFEKSDEHGKDGVKIIESYLKRLRQTRHVRNVESDPVYRMKDIDLLWTYLDDNQLEITVSIEVKSDRQYATGNYFLETISNEQKGTPGCFLYTEADFVYYFFIDKKELHIFKMPETRDWFLQHMNRFRERKTSTYGNRNYAESIYITVGRLVPRNVLQNELSDIVEIIYI